MASNYGVKVNDAYDMEYLIRCHPSIMADRNKLEFLMRVYKHLWPTKVKLRRIYDKLLEKLPYEKDWKSVVQENDFLNIYNYEDISMGTKLNMKMESQD